MLIHICNYLWGATVTSAHSSESIEQKYKYDLYFITPPKKLVIEWKKQDDLVVKDEARLAMTGSTITGTSKSRTASVADLIVNLEQNIRIQSADILGLVKAGTTRVINTMSIYINTSKYTPSEIASIQSAISAKMSSSGITITVSGAILPTDESYQGDKVTYTDTTPQPAKPVLGPASSNVKITDLR